MNKYFSFFFRSYVRPIRKFNVTCCSFGMTQKLCCGKWTKKKAFVVVVSFIFGVGGILNVFKIFRSVTTSSVISSGYMGYKAKEKVVRLGNDIMSLSKTISKLSKQKKINEIGEIRRKREENFKSKGALNANFEDETEGGGAETPGGEDEDAAKRRVKCSKHTNVGDPLVRAQSLVPDKDLPKRKAVVKSIPHEFCPRSLNPKRAEKEYLFWWDKANRKHMKFQADFLKRLDCDRHRSTSQFNQDIRMHRQFFKFKKGLVFVEVGAFDGVVFSNTYFEEHCLGWKGLCVEPQRRFAGIIQKSRACGVVNAAVAEADFGEDIDIVVGGVLGGKKGTLTRERRAFKLAMTYPEHKNVVHGFRLSTIFRANAVSHIDHLSVDCEGCELAVLNSIDYAAVKIRLIQIERNNKAEEIKAFLFERGYAWMEDLGEDAIYVTNEEAGKYQIP